MFKKINSDQLEFDKSFQMICTKRYKGHPRGCPNFNKKEGCPPRKLVDRVFDFDKDLFVIYTAYPVGEFAERMRLKHSQWKGRPGNWYNPRIWQGAARTEHRLEIESFLESYPDLIVDKCPEAMGINVTKLMKDIGIELKWGWPPEHNVDNLTYRISIAGYKK